MFKKIASNTIAQILSKVSTAIISIFLLSILTNYLSVELFGVYSKVYNYLGIFAFLADLGLYTIMIREISKIESSSDTEKLSTKKNGSVEKIVGNVLTLRVFLGVIIIILALLIAYFLPSYNSALELMAIAIVGVFTLVSLMNSTFLAYMQSQLKMEFSLFSVIFGKIVNLALILLIVFAFVQTDIETGLLYILGAGLVGIGINTFLNYWYANKNCNIGFRLDYDYMAYVFKISLPYGLALFLSVIYFKIDIILLAEIEPKNQADVSIALYSLPMKIVEVLMVISGFYLNSILPKLSQLFEGHAEKAGGGGGNIQDLLVLSFKILFSFGLAVATFGILFRDHVISIIANESYISPLSSVFSSSDAFLIVLGVLVFNAVSLLFIYIFIAAKKQSILLKINIFITLFNIIGNMVMIPKYSFVGAGVVTLFSQILLFIITYYYSRKIVKFNFPKVFTVKILLLSSVFFITLYYLLENYGIGLYVDIFVYGVLGMGLYSFIIWREVKR